LEFKEFLESVLIGAKQQTAQSEKQAAANVNVMIVGKAKAGKTSFVLSAMKDTEALSSGILPRFDYVFTFNSEKLTVEQKKKELKFDGHRMNMNIYDPPNREYANLPGQVDKVCV
jgi:septin family protein